MSNWQCIERPNSDGPRGLDHFHPTLFEGGGRRKITKAAVGVAKEDRMPKPTANALRSACYRLPITYSSPSQRNQCMQND